MAIVFPLSLFPPSKHGWRVGGTPLSGGQPISGPGQSADAAAGGWWINTFQVGILRRKPQIGAWRALVSRLSTGVRLIEVPVLDALQPWPGGSKPGLVLFSDGSSFSDGSEWDSGPIEAALTADAYMMAYPAPPAPPTQATVRVTVGNPLQGGEYFSITGPSGAVRLHLIDAITASDGAGNYTVCVNPPFREDMAAGTPIDFNRPRCTMKADPASIEAAWLEMEAPFYARPKIVFQESGFVVPTE